MKALFQDLRYGIRMLVKSPAVTTVAAIALALGIGANTAIFSVVDAVLLKPLPYKDSHRLFVVWEKPPGGGGTGVSAANFLDWKDQNRVFEATAASGSESFNLSEVDEPENIQGRRVSANFFDVLGMKPVLGRTFLPEEEQPDKEKVVVLSYRLWQQRFGADPAIVGRTATLNGEKYAVVGVMGAYFSKDLEPILWTPLALNRPTREFRFLQVIGRLKPDVTQQQAQEDMDNIARTIAEQHPETNKGWGVTLVPMRDQLVASELRQSLYVLLGAVGFVLLIACANVANLTLARSASRRREIAVRAALGAGRLRLVRQLLTESGLLGFLGGALGLLLAHWLVEALIALMPAYTLPVEALVAVDRRVLVFTLGVSLLTGALFGSVPAWQGSKPNLNESLKEGGRSGATSSGRHRFRSLLVVSEVALALMLLVGAGLLIHSFLRLQQVKLGFDSSRVLTMALPLSMAKYPQGEQVTAFYRRALEQVKDLPGVKQAAIVTSPPLQGGYNIGMLFSIGRPTKDPAEVHEAPFQIVSPGYFRAMRIPLLRGRDFTERDTPQAPLATIVNQALVRRFFSNEDPIGKKLFVETLVSGRQELGPPVAWQIIGVVGTVKVHSLGEEESPEIYVPYSQSPWPFTRLVVRTATDPMALANSVKSAIRQIDKDQPVTQFRTMEQVVTASAAQPRFWTILLGLFAAIALTLAAVGIYGVISYAVTQRTHEIGVRLALGAQKKDVLNLVVRQSMVPALNGVGIGLVGALAVTRLMSSLLYSVTATDPVTFIVVSLLLTVVALLACYIPARRATKVDPVVALRYE